jgi:hypothetical protein
VKTVSRAEKVVYCVFRLRQYFARKKSMLQMDCLSGLREKKKCMKCSEVNQVKLDSSSKSKNQISINKKNCLVAYTTEPNPVSKGIIRRENTTLLLWHDCTLIQSKRNKYIEELIRSIFLRRV